MKDYFKTGKVKILLSALLALIVLSVFTHSSENSFISSVFSLTEMGLSRVTAAAVDKEKKLSYDELEEAYEKLRAENIRLRAEVVDYYDTKAENIRLWKFYDLKKDHPDFQLVPAVVLRVDPNDEFAAFTLDKGTTSDVAVGDPVITDSGIVGWVAEADAYTAKVATVLSPRTSIGAVDNKTGDSGIVIGSAKFSDKNRTVFSKLSSDHKVKEGDIITTTGISGLYPKGLVIGEVKDLGYDTYDTSYYAVIEPFDDIAQLRDAAVITRFDGEGEVLLGGSSDE